MIEQPIGEWLSETHEALADEINKIRKTECEALRTHDTYIAQDLREEGDTLENLAGGMRWAMRILAENTMSPPKAKNVPSEKKIKHWRDET